MKQYRSLIKPTLALAAVGLWLYIHRYPTARVPNACEQFTASVAVDFVVPEWCKRIPIEAERGAGGFAPPGLQIDSLRSDCFLQNAVQTNNEKLCHGVRPIRSDWFGDGLVDGTGFNKAYCIDWVTKCQGRPGCGLSGGVTLENSQLAPIMHQLGYTEQTLLDAGIDPSKTFGWDDYVHKLLFISVGMPRYEHFQQEKRDFLRKVDHLHCREPIGTVAWNVGVTVVLIVVTFFAALRVWSILK